MISIENFDPRKKAPPYIDSPRSLEACRRTGIDPEELVAKPRGYFRRLLGKQAPKAIVHMHKEHDEDRRQEKLKLVSEERLNIMREGEEFVHTGSSESGDKNNFLIEHEQRKLELLQKKQEIEVQQMLEHERVLDEIRRRNEEKEAKARMREEQRLREVETNRLESEVRRLREEERKRTLESAREQEIKDLQQQKFEQEQRKLRDDVRKAKERKRAARARDLEMQEKQDQLRQQTEEILSEQRAAVEAKRRVMEHRDAARLKMLEKRKKTMQKRSEEMQRAKSERMIIAQMNLQEIMKDQRMRFEEKQLMSEEKRRMFEHQRFLQRQESARRSQAKQQTIARILAQSRKLESRRKQAYLATMERAEQRRQELEAIAEYERLEQLREEEEREREREEVRRRMEILEAERKAEVFMRIQQSEAQVEETRARQAWEHRLKQERIALKRKDREEEVKRVARVQEYMKQKTLERIKSDNAKAAKVFQEKQALMEMRLELRRQIEAKKQQLLSHFESLKRKRSAKSSHTSSKAFYFTSETTAPTSRVGSARRPTSARPVKLESGKSSIRDDPSAPARPVSARKPADKDNVAEQLHTLRSQKTHILREELEHEQQKEDEREALLESTSNLKERARLEKLFTVEREQASERLQQLAAKFDESIAKVKQSLR